MTKERKPDITPEPLSVINPTRQDRARVREALANADTPPAVIIDRNTTNPSLRRFRDEYDQLPGDVQNRCPWDRVLEKLLAHDAAKLKKATAMQGGGQLFHITENGDVLFKDKGVEPVMYGWDKPEGKEDRQLVQIYDREQEGMARVKQWASAREIEARVNADGYEFFEVDCNDSRHFSETMKRAEACNPDNLFIASADKKEYRETILKNGCCASFHQRSGHVRVYGMGGFCNPERRGDGLGAVRLLRV